MLRVGLIGTGNWGANLARVLNQSNACEFVALFDSDSARMNRMARQYPSAKAFDSAAALLREVDAVLIATPISTHFEVAKQAIEAGKHVFVEKPITATSAEAAKLVELAKAKNVILMVGHTFIYTPAVQRVKEEIASGKAGDIHYITSQRVNLGPYRADADASADLAVHDISILLYWLGEMPLQASSFGRACVHNDNQDVSFLWLQFASGVVGSIEVSWLSPQKLRRTCVVGTAETIVYDDTEASDKIKIYHRNMEFREPETFGEFQLSYRMGDLQVPYLQNFEPLQVELEHFLDCVKTGKTPTTDGVFGMNVVKVLEMAAANPMLKTAASRNP